MRENKTKELYVGIPVELFTDRRFLGLTNDARAAYCAAHAYCIKQKLDGLLHETDLGREAIRGAYTGDPLVIARELVDSGLWTRAEDGGYWAAEVPGYGEDPGKWAYYYPTAEQLRVWREQRSINGRHGAMARHYGDLELVSRPAGVEDAVHFGAIRSAYPSASRMNARRWAAAEHLYRNYVGIEDQELFLQAVKNYAREKRRDEIDQGKTQARRFVKEFSNFLRVWREHIPDNAEETSSTVVHETTETPEVARAPVPKSPAVAPPVSPRMENYDLLDHIFGPANGG